MLTLKLPFTTSTEGLLTIETLMKEYSPIVRSAYCRFMDGDAQLQVRNYLRSIFPNKDSWFLQSAIYEAKGMAKVDINQSRRTRIFGGKKNFIDRTSGKITKAEYRESRLLPIVSIGEAPQHGNRKFKINSANNTIIFKISRHNHVILQLPNLRKNLKTILKQIELLCLSKETPVTYHLNKTHICISFDESKLPKQKQHTPIKTRCAGIDLNPNYIGFVIYDSGKLLLSRMYDLTELTINSGKSSNSNESKHLTNKLHHELNQITKQIIDLCSQYRVNILSLEDLNMKSGNRGKGTNYNRLVNNKWCRNKVIASLKKRCNLLGGFIDFMSERSRVVFLSINT